MDDRKNTGRSYIREQIVPKKKYKKILQAVGLTLVLAVVFGGVAAVSSRIVGGFMGNGMDNVSEMVIIARDDTSEAESETEESTEAFEESSAVPETPAEEEQQEEITIPEETEPAEITIEDIYARLESSLVTICRAESNEDIFMDNFEHFGFIAAVTNESVFILTDGNGISADDKVVVDIFDESLSASVMAIDSYTNIAVVRISRKRVDGEPEPITLSNSLQVEVMDTVYMLGSPLQMAGTIAAGRITGIKNNEDVYDGYRQLIYTDMLRLSGGSAILVDEEGAVIGWISDYSSGNDSMVVAAGISPLKYLIEDLCSSKKTASLGVQGMGVGQEKTKNTDIPSGFYIQSVLEDSPAYLAGVQPGDCLLTINGETIKNSSGLQKVLDELEPKTTVTLEISRKSTEGYETMELELDLGSR